MKRGNEQQGDEEREALGRREGGGGRCRNGV